MKIEIDQSGKIENTNRLTVIAFSNSKNGAVAILSREKKLIQKYFRQIGKPKLFIPFTFVAAISILLKNVINETKQILVDCEHVGFEKLISSNSNVLQKTWQGHVPNPSERIDWNNFKKF